MKRLDSKIAVVYGDGGVGSAIAKAFAREGAKVILTGRTAVKTKAIADEISSKGGDIETALVDTLDETTVEHHMHQIIETYGRIDISFNATGLPQAGIQGIPIVDLSVEDFIRPVNTYSQSHFITARAAIRRMAEQGAGVIIMHTPSPGRISQSFIGGMPSAWASIEALCRSISVEYGDRGVRSVCLLTTAIPETPLIDEVYNIHGKVHGSTYDQFRSQMEGRTHRKRLTSIEELASSAVFAASDEGGAITGTILNITGGMVVN
jgi:NAD(P)-dependent dehydrogenase (short-subunit alcohol dehydrogenase family)